MMLRPKAYGFPIGRRLRAKHCDPTIVTMAEETSYWFNYTLPLPKNMTGYDGGKSCLIMLILFLIAPGLKRIPAFNLGGTGWRLMRAKVDGKRGKRIRDGGVGYPFGELKVGFTSLHNDNLCLVSITVMCIDTQGKLREKLVVRVSKGMANSSMQRCRGVSQHDNKSRKCKEQLDVRDLFGRAHQKEWKLVFDDTFYCDSSCYWHTNANFCARAQNHTKFATLHTTVAGNKYSYTKQRASHI
jgi:hypothetical protein